MKLERISPNQIKYSITFEELTLKGFIHDEMLKESYIWDDLFEDMLDEASKLFELDECEAVAIEIYSLTSQELVLIVTLDDETVESSNLPSYNEKRYSDRKHVVFEFMDIEDWISLSKSIDIGSKYKLKSSLYMFKGAYYLILTFVDAYQEGIVAQCEEYGRTTVITEAILDEYGMAVCHDKAFETFQQYF
ncbi:adaptor protein MecA [Bacillus sp. FJAT-50079]|uniref:adaptor protein MecA n=1 Tax=Bacillus sp. FJAT-50079 TaxID=2833577 RepID=UPI001BC8DACC|nr:adaptor protein MecA [Bacillus sp. FJAT-50079]MBS4209746.1 adaptor protein MecA [Bacillus sp. FJAT-50079]